MSKYTRKCLVPCQRPKFSFSIQLNIFVNFLNTNNCFPFSLSVLIDQTVYSTNSFLRFVYLTYNSVKKFWMTRFYTIALKCMQSEMNGTALSHRWKLQEIKLKLVSIGSSLTVTKKGFSDRCWDHITWNHPRLSKAIVAIVLTTIA